MGGAVAGTGAALGGEPGEERVLVRGVGVQRHEAHVAAVVEDLLGAVAVVVVDVEDRDARAALGPRGRGDRRVVEEAVARVRVGGRVMAGRSGERVRGARVAAGHRVPRAHRHVDRADRRGPRAGEDRVVVVRVPAERRDRVTADRSNGWPRIARAYGTASRVFGGAGRRRASARARVRGTRRSRRCARAAPDRGRARSGARIGPMPAAAIAARMRSARSGTSGGSIMRPWSWNGWRGWCWRCASEANVSMRVAVARPRRRR